MSDEKSSSSLNQIVIAVVIALITGSSAPFWWQYVFPRRPDSNVGTEKQAGFTPDNSTKDTPKEAPKPSDNANQPSSDFPGGSRRIYAADFAQWPTNQTQYGVAQPKEGEYVLQPTSNTWIGPGKILPIDPVDGDFVFDINFRTTVTESNHSASLEIELLGSGQVADYVTMYFELWDPHNVTYTLEKGWLKDSFYVTREKTVADRVHIPESLANEDWSKEIKVTLKRESGKGQLFINDKYVQDFPIASSPIANISVGAAFPSTISITSIEGRTKS